MSRWRYWFLPAFLWTGALLPAVVAVQPAIASPIPPASQQDNQRQDRNNRNQKAPSQRQLFNELATPYKSWLNEDIVYLITDEERRAFLQLSTNEEREQFIEQFWQRRNPNPDSTDNAVKEEHYRRIAYANEHFASGFQGWKSDRGRIYIMYGAPDSKETHSQGETWFRPPSEGGGQTKTLAYETWTYNYIEGLGNNVVLEFVDTTGTGEFRFTTDPSEKDALTHVAGEGLSQAEEMGLSSKNDRFRNTDGTNSPMALPGFRSAMDNQFSRIELAAKIWQPPPVKFKDLESIVSSRIVRDQLQFTYRFDFMRIAGDTLLVPITVQIPNNQMSFQTSDGVHTATLNLFARITTMTGRVVQTFEDTVRRDFPDTLLQQSLRGASIYQKSVPLRPGLYRLDLVIKDTTSNDVGVVTTRLAVPAIEDEKLAASSLILADSISSVAAKDIGIGQFVIGSTKVRPKIDQVFSNAQSLGIFLQFYNVKVDDKTHKNDASILMQIFQGDRQVAHLTQSSADMKQNGEQLTVQQVLPLNGFPPGKYRVEVKATDALANQIVSRSAEFTVTPAEDKNAAAQASPAR